jgi:hypothetical protein
MTDNHPITPPPELVQRLCDKAILSGLDGAKRGEIEVALILEAFAAGADMELEACCGWLREDGLFETRIGHLRAARRPKPPSLNEVALQMLGTIERDAHYLPEITDTIRRALEQLDD